MRIDTDHPVLCGHHRSESVLRTGDNGGNARVAQVEDRSHSVRSSRVSRGWLSRIATGELACRVRDLAGTVRQLRDAGSHALRADQRATRVVGMLGRALAGVQDVSYPSGHAW